MATIGGLSGSTSNSVNMYGATMKGYGGLASGLDTDSLIEGMTLGTRTKIQEALKKKQNYQWEMDAYRSISSQLINFSGKYLSNTGTSSPFRVSFFDKSVVTAMGKYSNKLNVSGVSGALESMSIAGIKQLARNTKLVTENNASIKTLNTGDIQFGKDVVKQNLDGESLTINFDNVNYKLNFDSTQTIILDKLDADGNVMMDADGNPIKEEVKLSYDTPEHIVESVNRILNNTKVYKPAGSTEPTEMLGSKVQLKLVTGSDGKENFALVKDDSVPDTKYMKIGDGSSDAALKLFGFMDDKGIMQDSGIIGKGAGLKGTVDVSGTDYGVTRSTFQDFLAGKEITFSYNGSKKTIKLPDANTIKGWTDKAGDAGQKDMVEYMQKQLDDAFGKDRIKVDLTRSVVDPDNGKNSFGLSFKTEESSVLRITDAADGIMGKNGVLGTSYSTTNRLDMDATLANCGLDSFNGITGFGNYTLDKDGKKVYVANDYYDTTGQLKITINGKKVEGAYVDSSFSEIIRKINASDAGVKLTYVETADRFSIESTNNGAAGKIEFNGANGEPTDIMSKLLGGPSSYTKTQGQDAIMTVVYEGNVTMDITRDTNSFNLDGATFTLKETFGYTGTGTTGDPYVYDSTTEHVTFSTAVDADKMAKVISSMIDDYNKVLNEVYDQVKTKPTKGYGPLTEDEKAQLSADEIKRLEDKAKEGILFNDPLLRSLADQLRSVFTGVTDIGTLKNMGIEISTDYNDNGKISFNEESFKNAVLENTEAVKELFTKPATDTSKGGFTVRLKSITDSFAKKDGLVKGSLIEKAGSIAAPTSVLSNSLKKLMDALDDQVDNLKDKLQTEIDRYTRQFSSLEQLISQMNSQSSWLQSATGG